MPILDHFSILAPIYDRAVPPGEREKFFTLLDLPLRGNVLDAGGGTGRLAQLVRTRAAQVVVADPSLGMLHQAVDKPGLWLVNSPSEALPFPSGYFDRVMMVDALHHVFSQAKTARELWRVVKPGGRIVIEEPDIRTFIIKIVAIVEKIALMRSHFFTPARIAALFPFSDASIRIEQDGYTAWVLIEKKEAC